ncbi:DNA glycosylase AlkZ-like family protein [Microlunatus speluncae]|uniref:DNA glycosylase AlkZ-like family protein n=1 Tax=Microlunatus speluncae TaxID=2594267 RepID=UPI001FE27C7C|nr:crosslink repair DNA glycosylase YcaQ family protein [Microlunatus speluncae]
MAVRAQLLDSSRPSDLAETVRHLTLLQNDLTAAVAPSAGLVAWSRLGWSCSRHAVAEAVDHQSLIDLRGMLRPAEDLALYRAEMAEWAGEAEGRPEAEWVRANESFRRDLLAELRRDGPLTQRELPDTCEVPWRSSGWNNNRNLATMLELLVVRGEVAAAGRRGRDRLWDLAERIYPDDDPVPQAEAYRIRDERRLKALGIARGRAAECPFEPNDVGAAGEPAVIEGVKGEWRVDPNYLGGTFTGRAAILSPLDRLVFDRKRMAEIFEFDYQLEMYKPAAKRRWGYWAMPILYGDRLVGKIDATTDREHDVLRVDAIHQDVPFSKIMITKVNRELADLADWLQVSLEV